MNKTLFAAALGGLMLLASAPVLATGNRIYVKAGVLGAGIGYAHDFGSRLALRVDYASMGEYTKSGTSGAYRYEGSLRNDVTTAYLDLHPFAGAFRLTVGVGMRDTRVLGNARPGADGTVTIGGQAIEFGSQDVAEAVVEFPDVAPYVGIGWSSANPADKDGGWGASFDLGVYVGKPDVAFVTNQAVRDKLGAQASQAIERQRQDLEDDAGKLKAFPSIYAGVSYTF